ncbi:hypothetical protein A2982_00145 [candidate division WWE3 bacterium RIFCSPLOWO2_01_FULL_39_13]|uniref:PD-(D/E)XK endonuclease-like domain-containing protein n=1 Tax=candidate division WWE3 bacterium RIFCSPLOWO2_01_FULL_39_13 TaxID=1802624 RepID=A0A1F4V5Y4_UNCKA|nr:MAG: hypothetical protein A2982_00145 [candidate division WWE3 bacterium RIFCSPLOWO2_01_FULL_39_13]
MNETNPLQTKTPDVCPYCQGKQITKKGIRSKKYEQIQIYYCKKCQKKFTASYTKGKTYPLKIILDAVTAYNRLNSLDQSANTITQKYGIKISPQNVANWAKSLRKHLSFLRMREFVNKKYDKHDVFIETQMFHGQIYNFKYHRAKTDLILDEDFKHYKLRAIQEFLELVVAECPHQAFKESTKRASEYKNVFNLDQVKISPKTNTANENTRLILQSVANNKLRHEVLQEFMLVNDSVTIACEIPVILDYDDIWHYKNTLGFDVPIKIAEDEKITGHIDLLQIRNGQIHILDYKPSAKKAKPVDQLTLYGLALARLTGLRLIHFKCAWFDENDYFEFYPLHVVYKKFPSKRKKKSRSH